MRITRGEKRWRTIGRKRERERKRERKREVERDTEREMYVTIDGLGSEVGCAHYHKSERVCVCVCVCVCFLELLGFLIKVLQLFFQINSWSE